MKMIIAANDSKAKFGELHGSDQTTTWAAVFSRSIRSKIRAR